MSVAGHQLRRLALTKRTGKPHLYWHDGRWYVASLLATGAVDRARARAWCLAVNG